MSYSVKRIAALISEDVDMINELGREGGRHPGKQNKQNKQDGSRFDIAQSEADVRCVGVNGPYRVFEIRGITEGTMKVLVFFKGIFGDIYKRPWESLEREYSMYLPMYAIFKANKPVAIGSENGTRWYDARGGVFEPDEDIAFELSQMLEGAGVSPDLVAKLQA